MSVILPGREGGCCHFGLAGGGCTSVPEPGVALHEAWAEAGLWSLVLLDLPWREELPGGKREERR